MADEQNETVGAEHPNRPNALTRMMRSGGGRIEDEPVELPAHLKSLFAEPEPGSILHTIQESSKTFQRMRDALGITSNDRLQGALGMTSKLDEFVKQNSIMAGFEKHLNPVGNQFARLQEEHRKRMSELVRDIQPISTPAVKMVGLLNDMRDAMDESNEHNRLMSEALMADAIRQEEQIRQLREANLSMRQAVERAEADAQNAEKSSEDNRRLANIGITIGVVGLLLAVASIIVTVMTAKSS